MFGLLKPAGKIEIQLEKNAFALEEAVKGKVILEVDGVKKARELRLTLKAYRNIVYQYSDGGRETKTQTLNETKLQLDGEHEYAGPKEYPFELKTPSRESFLIATASIPSPPTRVANSYMRSGQPGALRPGTNFVMPIGSYPEKVRWVLNATLDVPAERDASKEINLAIS